MTNNFVSFEDFVSLKNSMYVKKNIPKLGSVYIYKMSFQERLDFESAYPGKDGATLGIKSAEAMSSLIQLCVCDKNKRKIFHGDDRKKALLELEARTFYFLLTACINENYLSLDSVDNLEKN